MAKERKKNIMSVELAIQRELAYREKIASFLSEKEKQELLPLKVPCSTTFTSPYPSPMQYVGQSSISTSASRNQSSYRGKSPTLSPGPGHGKADQQHNISNRSDIFCKICKVSCLSPSNYKQHIRGEKHRAMLHSPKLNKNAAVGPSKNQQPRCNVCQIVCMDETSLQLHLNGQKHKVKLRMNELGRKGEISQLFWCEMCQVPCNNEETFQLHLKGKNHVARKYALEGEKKAI